MTAIARSFFVHENTGRIILCFLRIWHGYFEVYKNTLIDMLACNFCYVIIAASADKDFC